ncbi:hypothetical protein RintRC_7183 [Richelia intracellularis]|nr:hypothetical protein RintRC_7183 [Richelia intracellularis]
MISSNPDNSMVISSIIRACRKTPCVGLGNPTFSGATKSTVSLKSYGE